MGYKIKTTLSKTTTSEMIEFIMKNAMYSRRKTNAFGDYVNNVIIVGKRSIKTMVNNIDKKNDVSDIEIEFLLIAKEILSETKGYYIEIEF